MLSAIRPEYLRNIDSLQQRDRAYPAQTDAILPVDPLLPAGPDSNALLFVCPRPTYQIPDPVARRKETAGIREGADFRRNCAVSNPQLLATRPCPCTSIPYLVRTVRNTENTNDNNNGGQLIPTNLGTNTRFQGMMCCCDHQLPPCPEALPAHMSRPREADPSTNLAFAILVALGASRTAQDSLLYVPPAVN